MAKSMGKFISSLRKANGYTQEGLAKIIGVSNKTVSSWETDNSTPDLSLIPILADLLHVSCDEILRGEKNSISETEAIEGSTDKVKKGMLKNQLIRYQNRVYISYAMFFMAIVFLIPGIIFCMRIFGLCLLLIGICTYVGGVTFSIISYNSVKEKNSEIFEDKAYNRFLLKKKIHLQCLYSFFLLSFLFCLLGNREFRKNPIYQIKEEEMELLKKNVKLKSILLGIGGGFVAILLLFYILSVHTTVFNHKYTKDEMKKELYTITIEFDSNHNFVNIKSSNYDFRFSVDKERVEECPTGTFLFDIYFDKAKYYNSSAYYEQDGFMIAYNEKNCMIMFQDYNLLTLYKNETNRNTVYFSFNQNETYVETRNGMFALKNEMGMMTTWLFVIPILLFEGILIILYFIKRKKIY